MWSTVLHGLRDVILLISRCVLGGVLILHGWQRWQTGIDDGIARLTEADLPLPALLTWGSLLLELVGGIFLIFGALTPVVALLVFIESATIIIWFAWDKGASAHEGGYEFPATMAALALIFVGFGAGRLAIDNLLRRPDDPADTRADPDAYPGSP